MLTLSNPRSTLTVNDWPYGQLRTVAVFSVESNKRGERVSRTTTNPKTGRTNKPKTTTYVFKALICDGSDNRTYILELTMFNTIYIRSSDMVHDVEILHDKTERYAELLALFGDHNNGI